MGSGKEGEKEQPAKTYGVNTLAPGSQNYHRHIIHVCFIVFSKVGMHLLKSKQTAVHYCCFLKSVEQYVKAPRATVAS